MKAVILNIGNELLNGQVINTNAAWLAKMLHEKGIIVCTQISCQDQVSEIIENLKFVCRENDLIFITGGLGPTKDDVTKKALCHFLGLKMIFHDETWREINSKFTARNYPISELHRQQCYMPEGAEILENKVGTAPGLRLLYKESKQIFVLPGVPYEMQHIYQCHISPRFQLPTTVFQHTFLTAGTGETVIADHIESFEKALPENYKIAYLPNIGQVRVRLDAKNTDIVDFEAKCSELRELLKDWIYGEGEESLEWAIGNFLMAKGYYLATAESCTGGKIASKITAIPGCSAWYKSSVIAYSNEIKISLLDVAPEIISSHGAVSQQCVESMVKGALKRTGTDIAIATSGIAGPDGGTPDKPVGTIWIACGNKDQIISKLIQYNKDRDRNIEYASTMALHLCFQFLKSL